MFARVLTSISILLIITALIIIKNDLEVIKRNDIHHIIKYSRFMRLMDRLFNDFLECQRVRKILINLVVFLSILLIGIIAFIRYALPGTRSIPSNITPVGIGDWTDGELYRLLTMGIDKKEHTINHVMPFDRFSKADPNDINAIIAYIRTLEPIAGKTMGNTQAGFFHDLYNRTITRQVRPIYLKDLKTAVDSGKYLVNIASCADCHTPKKWVEINNEALAFSGGLEFPLATGGYVHSANLTPDESGLGNWSVEAFVNKFKSFQDSSAIYKIEPYSLNSLMPWSSYVSMTERDLKNIYAYLRTLKPVYNPVVKFTKERIVNKEETIR